MLIDLSLLITLGFSFVAPAKVGVQHMLSTGCPPSRAKHSFLCGNLTCHPEGCDGRINFVPVHLDLIAGLADLVSARPDKTPMPADLIGALADKTPENFLILTCKIIIICKLIKENY